MKSSQKILSMMVAVVLVALFSTPTPTSALIITNLAVGQTIGLATVMDTPGGMSVQIGDKLFGDFFYSYLDTDGIFANDLSRSNVVITALGGNFGFGLSFQEPLIAVGPVIKDVVIKYTALVTDPGFFISDVHLSITGSAGNGGLGSVGENVFTNGFGGTSVGTLQATLPVASGDVALANLVPPVTKLWVQKDVIVTGNSNPSGFASISIIDQQFSQVPEPSTVLLVGLGLLGAVALKRKS